MPLVDLHVVSWLRPKMTKLVIKAIHRNTKPGNFRLVVLDNGSADSRPTSKDKFDVKNTLDELFDEGYIDEVIYMPENVGLEPARSKLLYESTMSPYFICVDNDCLPPPIDEQGRDWVEKLVDLMERYEDYAAIACRTQVMIGTNNIFEETDKNGDDITDFPWPGGSLRIMRTILTRAVGGWRDTTPGRGAEERYICGKLRDAGYKTGFATNIRTLHLFGTRGAGGTDRWGYPPRFKPKKSGHNPIWHPVLEQGDQFDEVAAFAGEELAKEYFDA